jgi:hypothetical protein
MISGHLGTAVTGGSHGGQVRILSLVGKSVSAEELAWNLREKQIATGPSDSLSDQRLDTTIRGSSPAEDVQSDGPAGEVDRFGVSGEPEVWTAQLKSSDVSNAHTAAAD